MHYITNIQWLQFSVTPWNRNYEIIASVFHRYIKRTRLLTVGHSPLVAMKPAGGASAAMLRGNFYIETHNIQRKKVTKYLEKLSSK